MIILNIEIFYLYYSWSWTIYGSFFDFAAITMNAKFYRLRITVAITYTRLKSTIYALSSGEFPTVVHLHILILIFLVYFLLNKYHENIIIPTLYKILI